MRKARLSRRVCVVRVLGSFGRGGTTRRCQRIPRVPDGSDGDFGEYGNAASSGPGGGPLGLLPQPVLAQRRLAGPRPAGRRATAAASQRSASRHPGPGRSTEALRPHRSASRAMRPSGTARRAGATPRPRNMPAVPVLTDTDRSLGPRSRRRVAALLQEPLPRRPRPRPLRRGHHRTPQPRRMTETPRNEVPLRKTHLASLTNPQPREVPF
jgi:hypothetical protein